MQKIFQFTVDGSENEITIAVPYNKITSIRLFHQPKNSFHFLEEKNYIKIIANQEEFIIHSPSKSESKEKYDFLIMELENSLV